MGSRMAPNDHPSAVALRGDVNLAVHNSLHLHSKAWIIASAGPTEKVANNSLHLHSKAWIIASAGPTEKVASTALGQTSSPPIVFVMSYSHEVHSTDRITKLFTRLHTLRIVTTLALLILLIWHISTTFLVEHFDMPPVWEKDFTKPHLQGWRAGIWAMMFALVPLDLGYALWCLGKMSKIPSNKDYDDASSRGTSIPTLHFASQPTTPSTKPNLAKREYSAFSRHRCRRVLLVHIAFHILAITFCITHIRSYTISLQPSVNNCSQSILQDAWLAYVKLHPQQQLTFKDRCKRINWSIWVAGGFSCAGALIVVLLHIVTLGTRLWGLLWGRSGRSKGVDGGKGNGTGNRVGDDQRWDVVPRDMDVKLRGARLSVGLSMVSQGESGLKRRRRDSKADSSDEKNKSKKSIDNGSKAEAAWHGVLLECLVP